MISSKLGTVSSKQFPFEVSEMLIQMFGGRYDGQRWNVTTELAVSSWLNYVCYRLTGECTQDGVPIFHYNARATERERLRRLRGD